jgi:hypothetical protein
MSIKLVGLLLLLAAVRVAAPVLEPAVGDVDADVDAEPAGVAEVLGVVGVVVGVLVDEVGAGPAVGRGVLTCANLALLPGVALLDGFDRLGVGVGVEAAADVDGRAGVGLTLGFGAAFFLALWTGFFACFGVS